MLRVVPDVAVDQLAAADHLHAAAAEDGHLPLVSPSHLFSPHSPALVSERKAHVVTFDDKIRFKAFSIYILS